jgi:hypothetical protein
VKNLATESAGLKSIKVKKTIPSLEGIKGRVKKRSYHHPLPTPPPSRGREL